jgi:hypothetical protein
MAAQTWDELVAELRARGWNEGDFAALAGKEGQEFTDTINFINGLKAAGGAGNVDWMIRQRYPQMGWALAHAELGPLLRRAVAEGWDSPRLQGELLNTNWFRTTTEAEREWDRIAAEDPASLRQRFYDQVGRVERAFQQLGVPYTQAMLADLGARAGRSNWDDQQLQQRVLELATFAPEGQLQGQLNAVVDRVKQTANDYFTPIADQAAFDMGKRMLLGQIDATALQAHFKDLAMARFQGNKQIADMLNQGFTAAQIFAPYVQQTAQLLEQAPSAINLMDPKYSQIVDYADPNGVTRPMTLSEAGKFIRGTDAYKGTQGAVTQAADFAEFISQKMGNIA